MSITPLFKGKANSSTADTSIAYCWHFCTSKPVRGAAALAKAAGHSGAGGLTVGTLAQIGKAAMRSNSAVRGYRAGMRNIQRKNQTETSSKIAKNIKDNKN